MNNGRILHVTINSDIDFSKSLPPLNIQSDFSPTTNPILIEGNGHTLKAISNQARGFFCLGHDQENTITIRNLTLHSPTAKGGNGQDGGGGGAGLGGGIFVGQNSDVTLENIHFVHCQAVGGSSSTINNMGGGGGGGLGGNGGTGHSSSFGAGGGGGLFGNGGNGGSFSGGGGGGLFDNGLNGSKAQGGHGGNVSIQYHLGIGGKIDECGADGGLGNGGGGCGRFDTKGSFGGNGGLGGGGGGDSFAGNGGKGGYGGGGGGGGHGYMQNLPGGNGNDGGFGGGGGSGGGNSYNSKGGSGGTGGFGGGGGAGGPNGGLGGLGIYGGRGSNDGGLGGGGGALGGAIFIEKGGHLTIKNTVSFNDNSVVPGSGFEEGSKSGEDIFMMSGATLVFDIQKTVLLSTPIESDQDHSKGGGLVKQGPATLILSGENTYIGTTRVRQGMLLINGSITTPLILDEGCLGGQATVYADVNNHHGVVTNAYGTVHITQDYFQSPDGIYHVVLNKTEEPPILKIDGIAYLNGILEITSPKTQFKAGTEFEILLSELGISGNFSSIKTGYSQIGTSLFTLIQRNNHLFLIAQPTDLMGLDSVKSGNSKKTLDYIRELFPLIPHSDLSFAVASLAHLAPDELSKALDQLNAALYGGLEWMNLDQTTAIFSMITNHLVNLPCSQTGSCKDNFNRIWFQPYGYWHKYGKMGEISGFTSNEMGFALGYDRKLKHLFIGVLSGYFYTELNYDQNAGNGNIHSVFSGLYSKYVTPFYLTIDVATVLGCNFYDLARRIQYGDQNTSYTITRSAKSHHSAALFGAHLGLTCDFTQFSLPGGFFANLNYSFLNQERFQESGAKSLDLDIRDQESNMLQTELGAYSIKSFIYNTRCITFYLGICWMVKIPLSKGIILASFHEQDRSFKVNTTNKAVQFIVPKAAIKISTKNCLAFDLETYGELSGQYKSYYFSSRIEQRF